VSDRQFQPTPEQEKIRDAFAGGGNLVIEAGAGSGKTSTLRLIGESTRRRGLYVAYNRAIADDARGSFPSNVAPSTAHSLAYRAVGRQYAHRLKGPRVPARDVARILAITGPSRIGDAMLAPEQVARLVTETVARYARSADPEPTGWHVPRKPGLDSDAQLAELRALLAPLARKAWREIISPDGRLRFEHDHYLKLWALSRPQLPAEFILLDEAQDANPVILDVVTAQQHAQLIAVGDRAQAIYGWRGAVDAMDQFPHATLLQLSRSFRFGPAIADEANKWLTLIGGNLQLTGSRGVPSVLQDLASPDTVLCRTNAGVISQAMAGIADRKRVAVVGGGGEILSLAEAAIQLKAGAGTTHPELMAFRTWGEVQDHAENDAAGSDLKVLVRLIDQHGPEAIIDMTYRLVDERHADLIVSTAHKAKGREWPSVRIATDFREPAETDDGTEPQVSAPEAMLAYVAVTRARLALDRGGLAWVDKFVTREEDDGCFAPTTGPAGTTAVSAAPTAAR